MSFLIELECVIDNKLLTNNSTGHNPALVLVFFDDFGKLSVAYIAVGLCQLILS